LTSPPPPSELVAVFFVSDPPDFGTSVERAAFELSEPATLPAIAPSGGEVVGLEEAFPSGGESKEGGSESVGERSYLEE
jgi:hypothetical protein